MSNEEILSIVFVYGTMIFVVIGFGIKCLLDICKPKTKRNRLNK